MAIVFGVAVLVAIVTVVHQIVDAHKVFGVYAPHNPPTRDHMGVLLNPNSLAGYLNLAAMSGLGLLLSKRRPLPPSLLGGGIVLLVGLCFRSASRGGVLALPIGMAILGGLLLAVRSRGDAAARAIAVKRAMGVMTGALVFGAFLALLGADKGLWNELLSENAQKLSMPIWAKPMFLDFKWFGAGRGSFESVFTAYRPKVNVNSVFTHPENFVVQWLTEWGAFGILGLGVLGWLFRPTSLGATRSAVAAGGFAGIAILLLQNLADLGLELPGVSIALAMVLGSLWGDVARWRSARRLSDPEGERTGSIAIRWLRGSAVPPLALRIVAATSLVLAGLIVTRGMHTVADDRAELGAMLESKATDAEVLSQVRTRLVRHPADYYFPMVGAIVAERSGENPIAWIQRALERGPTVGRTHLVLAEVLSRHHVRNQALFEMRLAQEYEPILSNPVADLAVRTTRDAELLLRAVPDGVDGVAVLDSMSTKLDRPEDLPARERLDAEIVTRYPEALAARQRLLATRFYTLKSGAPPCEDRARCEAEIEAHAGALKTHFPKSSLGDQTFARLALARGDEASARNILEAGCKAPDDLVECLKMVVPLAKPSELDATIDRLVKAACNNPLACAEIYDWIGDFWQGRGQLARAFNARERAARESGNEARWLAAASTAEHAKLYREAVAMLEKIRASRSAHDATLEARIAADKAMVQ
jgi:hypothetical protein